MDLNFPFQRNGKFYKEEKNNISLLFKAGIEIQFFYNNWIQYMAVLFDSFSYRIKEVESGICYDRWHFGKYPELTMPEHLYYLNRVINCLLTHDKIIIRTDSLEEIIDVLGFEAFRLLYERQELVIIDNWWFPAFMIGNENLLFMNMHKSNYCLLYTSPSPRDTR